MSPPPLAVAHHVAGVQQRTERFRYRAVRPDGSMELGEVDAPSRDTALVVLSDRGLFPVEIVAPPAVRARRTRVSPGDLALGLRVLANLLEAGLPISRALAAFGELAPNSWRPGLEPLRAQVREGQTLAAALARSQLEIPAVVVGLIQAGEAGSGVPLAVRSAAELAEHAAATRAAIRAALTYPVILTVASATSIGLLIGVVLPRFAAILADLGQALPPTTRVVLAAVEIARPASLPALVGAFALVVLWRNWTAHDAGRTRWHAWLLSVPVVGTVRAAAATARACSATARLLRNGVPIASALHHAAGAAGDAAVGARLLAAREQVMVGERISRALEASGAFTPTAIRLVRAGEETGRLAELLEHGSRIEAERAQERTRAAVRLLEPTIILVFGGLVALVAAALLQAVYSVRPGG